MTTNPYGNSPTPPIDSQNFATVDPSTKQTRQAPANVLTPDAQQVALTTMSNVGADIAAKKDACIKPNNPTSQAVFSNYDIKQLPPPHSQFVASSDELKGSSEIKNVDLKKADAHLLNLLDSVKKGKAFIVKLEGERPMLVEDLLENCDAHFIVHPEENRLVAISKKGQEFLQNNQNFKLGVADDASDHFKKIASDFNESEFTIHFLDPAEMNTFQDLLSNLIAEQMKLVNADKAKSQEKVIRHSVENYRRLQSSDHPKAYVAVTKADQFKLKMLERMICSLCDNIRARSEKRKEEAKEVRKENEKTVVKRKDENIERKNYETKVQQSNTDNVKVQTKSKKAKLKNYKIVDAEVQGKLYKRRGETNPL